MTKINELMALFDDVLSYRPDTDSQDRSIAEFRRALEAALKPVAIPEGVRLVAQQMRNQGYRGPLAWTTKIIDFVADYTPPPAFEAALKPPNTTGWVAPKDHYAVPVLFDPYTGEPRDVRDVQSDPQGILIVPPGNVDMVAAPPAQTPRCES